MVARFDGWFAVIYRRCEANADWKKMDADPMSQSDAQVYQARLKRMGYMADAIESYKLGAYPWIGLQTGQPPPTSQEAWVWGS